MKVKYCLRLGYIVIGTGAHFNTWVVVHRHPKYRLAHTMNGAPNNDHFNKLHLKSMTETTMYDMLPCLMTAELGIGPELRTRLGSELASGIGGS